MLSDKTGRCANNSDHECNKVKQEAITHSRNTEVTLLNTEIV